ncbi:MAG TPA: dockerin type I domain-containing protein, partial [Planctomycetaceae bacterium]|nr:dockerin type I domain-containing protein [Planctomycetaceae bacterium]
TADGSIAFHNGFAGIMLADANGTNRHQVPNTKPNDIEPAWSPDGQWISFRRYSGAATANALWKIHPDGTGLTPLGAVCGSNTLNTARAWTPDGNYLIAPGTIAGTDGLYAVATDGSGAFLQIEISAGADPEWVGSTTSNISGSPVVSCCGDVNVSGTLTASDALLVLKAAVGSDDCPLLPCICDTNGNGTITATDALAVLRRAVGLGNALECQCS